MKIPRIYLYAKWYFSCIPNDYWKSKWICAMSSHYPFVTFRDSFGSTSTRSPEYLSASHYLMAYIISLTHQGNWMAISHQTNYTISLLLVDAILSYLQVKYFFLGKLPPSWIGTHYFVMSRCLHLFLVHYLHELASHWLDHKFNLLCLVGWLQSLNAKTGLFSKRMKIIHRNPTLHAQRVAAIKVCM